MYDLSYLTPQIPDGPYAIKKGEPLYKLLNEHAIYYLARNIELVYPAFAQDVFIDKAINGLESLGLMDRARHIAKSLYDALNMTYEEAMAVMLKSLTEPRDQTEDSGLATFFYLPHSFLISDFSPDLSTTETTKAFAVSMDAMKQLTTRFTAEFCIRPFLIKYQNETMAYLQQWLDDSNYHVRRLCTEGTRPRLPWGLRIPAFVEDPSPTFYILDALKDDSTLYVRRSVANHLGDITKSHPQYVFDICEKWLEGASADRRWLIRHALRYPDKKGDPRANALRKAAK